MKTTKIVFWISTGLIFLFEGVMPALTGHTEMAKQGVAHLGYPDYFRIYVNVWKILGSLAVIIPMMPDRIKEWAYFGLFLTAFSAIVSYCAVDGCKFEAFIPLVAIAILSVSYISYQKLKTQKQNN
jgi:uncharacterized membrane protein YphA (DoxX/SURF4 family)